MSAVTAVNTLCGPPRVMVSGCPAPQTGSPHTLAIARPVKCISIIGPRDGRDDEGFYGLN